jgi:hypothetical protein
MLTLLRLQLTILSIIKCIHSLKVIILCSIHCISCNLSHFFHIVEPQEEPHPEQQEEPQPPQEEPQQPQQQPQEELQPQQQPPQPPPQEEPQEQQPHPEPQEEPQQQPQQQWKQSSLLPQQKDLQHVCFSASSSSYSLLTFFVFERGPGPAAGVVTWICTGPRPAVTGLGPGLDRLKQF